MMHTARRNAWPGLRCQFYMSSVRSDVLSTGVFIWVVRRSVGVGGVRGVVYALILLFEVGMCCKCVGGLVDLALSFGGLDLLAYIRVPKADRGGIIVCGHDGLTTLRMYISLECFSCTVTCAGLPSSCTMVC